MSVVQLSAYLSFLSFWLLVVFLKWEIPINLGDAWLRVIGGFPCHIYSIYENYHIPPPRIDYPGPETAYNLPWTCESLLQPEGSCLSILRECPTRNGSQFSVDFWDHRNMTCKKRGRRVGCSSASENSQLCLNIVSKITNYTNIIQLDLVDLTLPATLIQEFRNIPEELNEDLCYQPGDHLDFRANDRNATVFSLSAVQFNVNATFRRTVQERSCEELQERLDPTYLTDIFLCNCDRCEINVLGETRPPNGICPVPFQLELVVPTEAGRIIGAVLKVIWQEADVSPSTAVVFKVSFPPYASTVVNSRFWSTRGRFHCPSEVTCWEELWFPLKRWTELEETNITFILIVSAILAILLWKGTTNRLCICHNDKKRISLLENVPYKQ